MTSDERSNIFNGIWLCSWCATLIDKDERRFPVEVLFRWRQQHEADILREQRADPGEFERRDELQKLFSNEPAAALQVALDQPENWPAFLVVELLRTRMRVQRKRRDDLRNGFRFASSRYISIERFHQWVIERAYDLPKLVTMAARVVTHKLDPAMDSKEPTPSELLESANAIEHVCDGLHEWELNVHRTIFPEEYADLKERMQGQTNTFFSELERLPLEIAKPLGDPSAAGTYQIHLNFIVPPESYQFAEEMAERLANFRR
ncbi:hypothetical protein [Sorangium sp. So ce1024]|uniref:hypothetical protein n=1 Tax=unclassified Sorangium TaxID=2621164 RepID=UPI003F03DE01